MTEISKVLHTAIIIEKISNNEYLVEDKRGVKTTMSFPKKYLMNYIKFRIGEKVYITISDSDNMQSNLITKQHFLGDIELHNQKIKLDALD